jgi:hypothetical protein
MGDLHLYRKGSRITKLSKKAKTGIAYQTQNIIENIRNMNKRKDNKSNFKNNGLFPINMLGLFPWVRRLD